MPTFTLDGDRIHYEDEGFGGPPLVFLHAFPLRSRMWEPQIRVFGAVRRVVAPDLRGFGESSAPEDPGAYSIEGWADDVAALVNELGVAPAVLVGVDVGGHVALSAAQRHQGLAAGLVLAGVRPEPGSPDDLAAQADIQGWLEGDGDLEPVLERMIGTIVGDESHRRPEVAKQVRFFAENTPRHGMIGAIDAMKRRADQRGMLAAVDLPTLVIAGGQDTVTPPDVAQAMETEAPDARLVVLDDAGHLASMEDPGGFNRAVDEFVRDQIQTT